MLRVALYGKLVDLAEEAAFTVPLSAPEMAVADVIALIAEIRPVLADELKKKSTRIVVNDVLDPENAVLREGDEIAFLPPVSGG